MYEGCLSGTSDGCKPLTRDDVKANRDQTQRWGERPWNAKNYQSNCVGAPRCNQRGMIRTAALLLMLTD
jgi:hypothetical protein